METININVPVPKELIQITELSEKKIIERLIKLLALDMYKKNVLSLGKACEICGFSKWDFFDLNKELGIPLNYDENDLESDLAQINRNLNKWRPKKTLLKAMAKQLVANHL